MEQNKERTKTRARKVKKIGKEKWHKDWKRTRARKKIR
jgi:hypothetical protein